jgi:hypothetical protein
MVGTHHFAKGFRAVTVLQASAPAYCQENLGTIVGEVTDQSGQANKEDS